jgi:hypothetical protein
MLISGWGSCAEETYVWRRCCALQVGLDGAVLLVEERHVRDKVLDDVHVREWVNASFLGSVCGNAAWWVLARQSLL